MCVTVAVCVCVYVCVCVFVSTGYSSFYVVYCLLPQIHFNLGRRVEELEEKMQVIQVFMWCIVFFHRFSLTWAIEWRSWRRRCRLFKFLCGLLSSSTDSV